MGLELFEEAAGNFAFHITTEKETLIFAGFFAAGVQIFNDAGGGRENLGSLDRGSFDRDFDAGVAGMESGDDFVGIVIPIEGILHFVTIKIFFAIRVDGWGFNVDFLLAEKLDHEFLL